MLCRRLRYHSGCAAMLLVSICAPGSSTVVCLMQAVSKRASGQLAPGTGAGECPAEAYSAAGQQAARPWADINALWSCRATTSQWCAGAICSPSAPGTSACLHCSTEACTQPSPTPQEQPDPASSQGACWGQAAPTQHQPPAPVGGGHPRPPAGRAAACSAAAAGSQTSGQGRPGFCCQPRPALRSHASPAGCCTGARLASGADDAVADGTQWLLQASRCRGLPEGKALAQARLRTGTRR